MGRGTLPIGRNIARIIDMRKRMAKNTDVIDTELLIGVQEQLRYGFIMAAGCILEQSLYIVASGALSNSRRDGGVAAFVKHSMYKNVFRFIDFKTGNESKAMSPLYTACGIAERIKARKGSEQGTAFAEREIAFVQLMRMRNEMAHEYALKIMSEVSFDDLVGKYHRARGYMADLTRILRAERRVLAYRTARQDFTVEEPEAER
jgi:hypothetical protein